MNEEQVRQLVTGVVCQLLLEQKSARAVPAEVSARHVHLSQTDVEALFGQGHKLTHKRDLSQHGQFLAEERVSIVTSKGEFRNVAVLGPARSDTQVELSLTDAKSLGLDAPVRQSGDITGCPSVCLMAGQRVVQTGPAALVAQNHIHMTPADAMTYGVHDGQRVRVEMKTARPMIFCDVVVRVRPDFALAMHIDFDEANACAFQQGDTGYIVSERQPAAGMTAPAPIPCVSTVPPAQAQCVADPGLLSAEDARRLAKRCGGVLQLAPKTILTPLARDVLREQKIRLLDAEGGALC